MKNYCILFLVLLISNCSEPITPKTYTVTCEDIDRQTPYTVNDVYKPGLKSAKIIFNTGAKLLGKDSKIFPVSNVKVKSLDNMSEIKFVMNRDEIDKLKKLEEALTGAYLKIHKEYCFDSEIFCGKIEYKEVAYEKGMRSVGWGNMVEDAILFDYTYRCDVPSDFEYKYVQIN